MSQPSIASFDEPAFDSSAADMDPEKQYVYEPLSNPNNIRLILVFPGEPDEQIDLILLESLLEKPDPEIKNNTQWSAGDTAPVFREYQALSYTWGDETTLFPIRVNGGAFHITSNLHGFLKRCRPRYDPDRPNAIGGPLWVDAICINQADSDEKSIQVRMMGEIYQRTISCVVWLGEEEDDSKLAMQLVHSAACQARQMYYEDTILEPSKRPSFTGERDFYEKDSFWQALFHSDACDTILAGKAPWGKEDGSSLVYSEQAWVAAYRWFARPWFARMWTLQEFILPKRLTFKCGSDQLVSPSLLVFHKIIAIQRAFNGSPPGWNMAHPSVSNWLIACESRVEHQIQGPASTAFLLSIMKSRSRLAREPADKIYGLLGLHPNQDFPVDYSRTVDKVYIDVAERLILELHGDLTPLYHELGLPKTVKGLPSWAPDWSVDGVTKFPSTLEDLFRGAGGNLTIRYNVIPIVYWKSRLEIHHAGVLVDSIKSVHAAGSEKLLGMPWTFRTEDAQKPMDADLEQYIEEEGLDSRIFQPSTQSTAEIILRTIMCDIYQFEGKQRRFDASCGVWEHLRSTQQDPKVIIGQRISLKRWDGYGRVFITTANGYMGMTYPCCKEGDVVAVMLNVPFPCVLRPVDNHFEILGQCWVHGMMDGEIMEEVFEGTRKLQRFVLK